EFRFGDDLLPARDGVLVAGLQRHHARSGPFGEGGVGVEGGAGGPVEVIERGDGGNAFGELVVVPGCVGVVIEILDEHSELGTPVPEVVLPDHLGSEETEYPDQAVTDDGGAQMTDV